MLATSAAAAAKRARGSIDESDSGSSHKSLQDDDDRGDGADDGADDDADGADDGDDDDADDDVIGASNVEARQKRKFWAAEVGRANVALPQLWKAVDMPDKEWLPLRTKPTLWGLLNVKVRLLIIHMSSDQSINPYRTILRPFRKSRSCRGGTRTASFLWRRREASLEHIRSYRAISLGLLKIFSAVRSSASSAAVKTRGASLKQIHRQSRNTLDRKIT